ncbi:hypothetical protein PMAYCL1PPCAC_22841, partial [Pristionchus mayeri]
FFYNQGFVFDGKLTVEARVTVKSVAGIRKPLEFDFTTPGIGSDNVVLVVEGKAVHVSRHVIITIKKYFSVRFLLALADRFDIKVSISFSLSKLCVISIIFFYFRNYGSKNAQIFRSSCLRTIYALQIVMDRAESFLIKAYEWRFSNSTKLLLADRHRLDIL